MECKLCSSALPDEELEEMLEGPQYRLTTGSVDWATVSYWIQKEYLIEDFTMSDLWKHAEHVGVLPDDVPEYPGY